LREGRQIDGELEVGHVDQDTAKLQAELWVVVARNAAKKAFQPFNKRAPEPAADAAPR
jgi:hypothetical protein